MPPGRSQIGQGQGGDRHHLFTREPQRDATGDQELEVGALRQELVEQGDTWQNLLKIVQHQKEFLVAQAFDQSAPIDARLVIFGDSYSYIEPSAAGNLGERLASAFREVHFVWAPFCWDAAYLEKHRPDAVLLQMAERFVVTVPRRDVDVEGLAIETLRRKSGIVPEEITTPATASPGADSATS